MVWTVTAVLATFLMLNWAIVRACAPLVWIGPLLGVPFLRVWFWSPHFHLVWFFTPHQVLAGTASKGQSLASHACPCNQAVLMGSIPVQGQAEVEHWGMPSPGVCWGFLVFFFSFFGSKQFPIICPQGMSFSSCFWAETAYLQQGDSSPSPAQICPYPCRISSICRDNGRWRHRQDWRCWLIY